VQLSGLSCLNEWRQDAVAPVIGVLQKTTSDRAANSVTYEDRCPCHLAFLSVPLSPSRIQGPAADLEPQPPSSALSGELALPFRPPLPL
jgi:hypothetical protein